MISFEIDGNIGENRFHPAIEIALYRVLCELVNNTLTHSGAASIHIKLMKAGGFLFIRYRDDGKGLPAGTGIAGHPGMGFSNIESRLKAIDGKIELEDAETGGFAVTITCPATMNEII